MSQSARRGVQLRKQEVANGWSEQERADRLHAGIASRAWLLDSINHTLTTSERSKMFGQKAKLAKSVFNAEILTVFGKLSQQDIDSIDGRPERLVTQLIQ